MSASGLARGSSGPQAPELAHGWMAGPSPTMTAWGVNEMPGKVPTMAKAPTPKRLAPAAAVDRLEALYAKATSALATALDRYLATRVPPSRETRALFRYPLLRIIHREMGQQ